MFRSLLGKARALRSFADDRDRFLLLLDVEHDYADIHALPKEEKDLLYLAAYLLMAPLGVLSGAAGWKTAPIPASSGAREYVIDSLFPARSVSTIIGKSGAGKSKFVLEAAHCLTTARPFAGHQVTQGAVLYFAGEGQAGLRDRLAAINAVHGESDAIYFRDNTPLLTDPATAMLNLLEALADVAPEQKIGLIVVDTQTCALNGADEDKAGVSAVAMGILNEWARFTGGAVLLISHVGHGETERQRGSTNWAAASDGVFLLKSASGHVTVDQIKNKDGESGRRFVFTDHGSYIDNGRPSTPHKVSDEAATAEAILNVGKSAPCSRKVLLSALREAAPGKFSEASRAKSNRNDAIKTGTEKGILVEVEPDQFIAGPNALTYLNAPHTWNDIVGENANA